MPNASPLVVVLAYDGLCTFEFGVAVELFGLPRPEMGEGWYRFATAAVEPGELRGLGFRTGLEHQPGASFARGCGSNRRRIEEEADHDE